MERLEEDIISKIELEEEQEIINAIRENRLYDHIVGNYWRIEDRLLIDLLLECIATLEEGQYDDLIDNLVDYKEWEYNEEVEE